jgi:hypothetical protein
MFIHGTGPVVGRRSFLFTSDMANKAALEIQQHPTFENMAHWHLMRVPQCQQNPSTSRGFAQFFWIYHFVKKTFKLVSNSNKCYNPNNSQRQVPIIWVDHRLLLCPNRVLQNERHQPKLPRSQKFGFNPKL